MNPFLTSQINDEHRHDLLREACAERIARDIQQARIAEPPRARKRASLVSVDMLLLQASLALTKRERAALCGDETG